MLATLIADGVFEDGWETTLGDVSPGLVDEVHADYRAELEALATRAQGIHAAGWQVVSRHWARGTAMTFAGSNGSWFTVLWIVPEARVAFAVAANSAEPNPAHTFKLLDRIVGRLIKVAS